MTKTYFLATLFTLIINLGSAQEQDVKEEHQNVQAFINCIANRNLDTLKSLVRYPLKREYSLPAIANEAEFIKRYDEVFDDALIKLIVGSDFKKDWTIVGQRGIMLNSGGLWLENEERLISVNYQSPVEKEKREEILINDIRLLHESINVYENRMVILEIET